MSSQSSTGLKISMGAFDLLERNVNTLEASLKGSGWNDSVKESYFDFVKEMEDIVSGTRDIGDQVNSLFQEVEDIDINELKSSYKNCEQEVLNICRGW